MLSGNDQLLKIHEQRDSLTAKLVTWKKTADGIAKRWPAWKQLMDPEGFYAPFGPATAERRHPQFKIAYEGDDCQWNGPSWPFATTITLRAMANLLNNYHQDAVSKADYFRIFEIYTRSQRLKLEDGRVIPWIDENLNPLTGELCRN